MRCIRKLLQLGGAIVRSPSILRFGAIVIGVALLSSTAMAQQKPKAPAKSTSARIAELKEEIEAQQLLIEEQRALMETQKAAADSQAIRIQQLEAQLQVMSQKLADLEAQTGALQWETMEERLKKIEEAASKSPELPPEVVSAGDFPGSIRIPGTDAALKIGGRIRTSVVLTLDPLGTDDRFLTNSIPVGVETTGEARRTNISARASRLNIEFRTPSGQRELRAFFEGDFAGEGNLFRLRHAYAQYWGLIVGQTWSTFSDPEVLHEDLDFEGVSSENLIRQPLLRYWWRPKPKMRAAGAIETPAVSITGGEGVNLVPDLIARLYWEHVPQGHLQVAGVLRQIRGESVPGDVRSDWAYGGSLSGVLPIREWNLEDRFMFQLNGGVGIARYINDLNEDSFGKNDAVFDSTTGDLEALPVLGWYAAYEHTWKKWEEVEGRRLRSTILWSFVRVYNLDFQPPDAYKRTNRFAFNVVYSPRARVDAGVQYILGRRTNKDDNSAHAEQFQLVMIVRF
jgi:hypothetical protein